MRSVVKLHSTVERLFATNFYAQHHILIRNKVISSTFYDIMNTHTLPSCDSCFLTSTVTERSSSEVLVGDTYAILAAHRLTELYATTHNRTHLTRAIALLEAALKASPANAQLKLLLFRLHIVAGRFCCCCCSRCAFERTIWIKSPFNTHMSV